MGHEGGLIAPSLEHLVPQHKFLIIKEMSTS